jgi:hypothetical protein
MFEVRLQTYWEDADPAGQVFFAPGLKSSICQPEIRPG